MKVAEGGRRKREESSPCPAIGPSLARIFLSLSPVAYEKTQRSRRLYLPERLTVRSVSGGPSATVATPPPPPLSHSVTLELSVEGHTACLYTRTQTGAYACTHARTSVYDAARCEKRRKSARKGREREREGRHARRGNRGKRFPHTTPLGPFAPTLSAHSLSLSFFLSFSFAPFATNDARARVLARQIHAYDLSA